MNYMYFTNGDFLVEESVWNTEKVSLLSELKDVFMVLSSIVINGMLPQDIIEDTVINMEQSTPIMNKYCILPSTISNTIHYSGMIPNLDVIGNFIALAECEDKSKYDTMFRMLHLSPPVIVENYHDVRWFKSNVDAPTVPAYMIRLEKIKSPIGKRNTVNVYFKNKEDRDKFYQQYLEVFLSTVFHLQLDEVGDKKEPTTDNMLGIMDLIHNTIFKIEDKLHYSNRRY